MSQPNLVFGYRQLHGLRSSLNCKYEKNLLLFLKKCMVFSTIEGNICTTKTTLMQCLDIQCVAKETNKKPFFFWLSLVSQCWDFKQCSKCELFICLCQQCRFSLQDLSQFRSNEVVVLAISHTFKLLFSTLFLMKL